MKKILPLILVFVLMIATSVVQAQGETPEDPLAVLGTGFTYQGWLADDGGSPLNGTCDFNFSLWDSLSDGAQVGAVSPVTNVAVAEGYFNAVVNGAAEFGSNAFKGSARWLEIALRCPAGAGDYTTLTPRQALTAAPYARYAVNAPWSGLSGIPADLADGDADTTYTNGTGITLSGGVFSLAAAYRLPQSCTDGQIAEWDTGSSLWTCGADNTNSGDITGVTAGTGLSGGGTSGAVTLALGTAYQLPQSCTDGQIAEWNTGTSLWVCAADNSNTGDITGVTAGTGLSGGGASGAVTLALGTAYQLPQSCTDGQIAEWDTGTSAWVCAADNSNTGDITGVTAGTGLSGGGASGAVTLALGTAYQLPQSCANGQPAEWDTGSSLWICGTDGTGNDWHLTGNTGTDPETNFIGTNDEKTLVLKVNGGTALRLEPDMTSPNIIGGSGANQVGADVHGATIGGGGSSVGNHSVTQSYGTIGGGYNNGVADDYGTISGGRDNTVYWEGGTVGGGRDNTAGQFYATVSGGRDNHAADYYSAIGGGENNSAQGEYSTIPGGKDGYALFYGQAAQASGAFATPGDAQASTFVLRSTSTSTSFKHLYLDGSSDEIFVGSGRTIALDILIVGRTEEGESAAYQITGVVENVDGTAAFIVPPTVTILGEDDAAWDVSISLSTYYVYLRARGNNETVRWVAVVRTAEVAWLP